MAATPPSGGASGRTMTGAIQGHSYPQAWYEDAIGTLLGEIGSLDD